MHDEHVPVSQRAVAFTGREGTYGRKSPRSHACGSFDSSRRTPGPVLMKRDFLCTSQQKNSPSMCTTTCRWPRSMMSTLRMLHRELYGCFAVSVLPCWRVWQTHSTDHPTITPTPLVPHRAPKVGFICRLCLGPQSAVWINVASHESGWPQF